MLHGCLQLCDHLLGKADQLALLCVVVSCVVVTFPCGVPGQAWYLIVSIPDLCFPLCFKHSVAALG